MQRAVRLSVLLLVIMLLAGAPGNASTLLPPMETMTLEMGSFVAKGDPEFAPTIRALAADTAICVDATSNATYWLIAAACPATLGAHAFRLTPLASYTAGSHVARTDADHGVALSAPAAINFTFLDATETEAFAFGDTAYLGYCLAEGCQVPGETVRVHWIRITPHGDHPAGSRVQSDDDDHGAETLQPATHFTDPLSKTTAHLHYWDLDGAGAYSPGDSLYWRTQGTATQPAPGWIRLTAAPGGDALSVLAPGGRELAAGILNALNPVSICFLDVEATGRISDDDPVYLVHATECPSKVPLHSLRLAHGGHFEAGSYVQLLDWDRMRTLSPANKTAIVYVDHDETGTFTGHDALYLLVCDVVDCEHIWHLRHGAIRLTNSAAGEAGTRVSGADPDFFDRVTRTGAAFTNPFAAGRFAYWSASGMKDYHTGDVVYWRPGDLGSKTPPVGSVRISGFPDGTGRGDILGLAAPEIASSLRATDPKPKAVCYATDDATGTYAPGDSVYVALGSCMDGVQPGAIRLTGNETHRAGTVVRADDDDIERELHNATAGFRSIPAGSPGGLATQESIYLCIDEGGCASGGKLPVAAGWVRLSPSAHGPAGTVVTIGDKDHGAEASDPSFMSSAAARKDLAAVLANHWLYWDLDGSGTLSAGDIVYLRMKGDATTPAEGDLRLTTALTALPLAWFPSLPDAPEPVPVVPDVPPDPIIDDFTIPDDTPPANDEELVPALAPMVPVLVIAALWGALRRRAARTR